MTVETKDAHKPASPMGNATSKPTENRATTPAPGRPAGVSKVPKDETPEAQFKRLCVPRVERTLNGLRMLKNLARLKPSDTYREKVIAALKEAVTALDLAWKGTADTKTGFQL
jgi:hypothetical protein